MWLLEIMNYLRNLEIRRQLSRFLSRARYLYPGVLAVHGDAEVVSGGEGVQPAQAETEEAEEEDLSDC